MGTKYIVQMRRGTFDEWDKSNIVPLPGELVVEIDTENNLHKLKIGDGIHEYADLAYLMAGDEIVSQVLTKAIPRVVTVTLDVDKWAEVTCETDPNLGYYMQELTLDGITSYSRLDLQPNADMIAELKDLGLVFVTENQYKIIRVYSVGAMPLKSYTMQATIIETDVAADHAKITGIPVGTPTLKADWAQTDETKADYIKNKPVVAQTYAADSTNAQSGVAVSEAMKTLPQPIIKLTWAELKALRDNAQLMPGQFYRITDYKCTTTQENTSADNYQFDIIVQALSTDKLSEIAKADYREGSNYFNIMLESGIIESNITSATTPISWIGADSYPVKVAYTLYVDFNSEDYNEKVEGFTQDEEIVYLDFQLNHNGVTVPVLYRTNIVDYPDEPAGDGFYYVGTQEEDGVVYDKWIKQDGDFGWNSRSKIYILTNKIVGTGSDFIVNGTFTAGEFTFRQIGDLPAWELKYCLDNDTSRFAWADEANGTGVIYWMKDGCNNECPYDFYNIKFGDSNTFSKVDRIINGHVQDNCIGVYKHNGVAQLNNVIITYSDYLNNVHIQNNCCNVKITALNGVSDITICSGTMNKSIRIPTNATAPIIYRPSGSTEIILDEGATIDE